MEHKILNPKFNFKNSNKEIIRNIYSRQLFNTESIPRSGVTYNPRRRTDAVH